MTKLHHRPQRRVAGLVQHVVPGDAAGAEIGEVAGERVGLRLACDRLPQSRRAHVTAEILLRLGLRRLGAGHENETAAGIVLGIQRENGVPGGAGACEEVEHDVAFAGGGADEVADQAERLGEAERLLAEDRLDLRGRDALAVAAQKLHVGVGGRLAKARDPTADRPGSVVVLRSLADDARQTLVRDRLADPEIKVGQVGAQQRPPLAVARH